MAIGYGRRAQPYFGPVVFTGGADSDGTTTGLTAATAQMLLTAAQLIAADEVTMRRVTTRSTDFVSRFR